MKRKTKRMLLAGGILLLAACLFVPHICSVKLQWDGIASLKDMNITAKLPKGAVAVKEKISPMFGGTVTGIALAGIMIAVILILKKTAKIARRRLRMIAVLSSVCSMPLHELMHGLACPAGSEVHIGIVPQKLLAYAVTNAPMNLAQFTAYMAVPAAVIGVLPLIGSLMTLRRRKKDAAMFLFIYGMLGLVQTAPDFFGLIPVLRQAPADAVVQISNGITYWFTR